MAAWGRGEEAMHTGDVVAGECGVEAWRAATFQAVYNVSVVVAGATCLGIAAGLVGSFTFLRRRALVADALSHATLPGIALAFLLGVAFGLEQRSLALLLAGAAATGALGVFVVQLLTRHTRLSEDPPIGAVLTVFFGVRLVLLSLTGRAPLGEKV